MKLIKYLKKVIIDPCKGCLVDPMCSRVCKSLMIYHNTRDNIIANIIVIFMFSVFIALIIYVIYVIVTKLIQP